MKPTITCITKVIKFDSFSNDTHHTTQLITTDNNIGGMMSLICKING